MSATTATTGSEVFIVDNSDETWKVLQYLRDWCQLSSAIDIATGYFEIGSLLGLGDAWQQVDRIRLLMGDEVTLRTKTAFEEGLKRATDCLDESIETEKEKNDFLAGVPSIVEAIRTGKINCRVYRKAKFHAKTYITHARQAVVGSFALVGSSNFTYPGLTQNVELNVQITGSQVGTLQQWYEDYWNEAEDVTPDVLRTIERHIREYSPFDVYAKSLQEFFRGHEMTAGEWELAEKENGGSWMYPVLDQYQQQGYRALMKIAQQNRGAFLCDGVGLGKTFIGMMLIERLVAHDRKRVALFVPKSARADVWERALRDYLPNIGGTRGGDFSNLAIFNHTDLGRGGDFPLRFERVKEWADVIVIDEAHHFRNPGIKGEGERRPSRYRMLYDLLDGPQGPKQMFMLTATPVNNSLHDFRHMAELFTRQQENYFARRLGIHSLRRHFIDLEKALLRAVDKEGQESQPMETNMAESERLLFEDSLFRSLVVQRSRSYVKKSQKQQCATVASFPEREPPKVAEYSIKRTYGRLLDQVQKAFDNEDSQGNKNPLFVLGIYYPLAYYRGDDKAIDPFAENRQKQVVTLIRTQFLKRFESSAHAFETSCERLLLKLLVWVTKHSETDSEKRRLERWKQQHSELVGYVHQHQLDLWGDKPEEQEDDVVSEEMLESIELLSRKEYRVEEILADTFLDLDQIGEFLDELRKFKPENDDKLKALARLLKTDPILKEHKALIFSEFADTARYLAKQLKANGIAGLEQIDSGTKRDRSITIRRFSPYYNGSSSSELETAGNEEIRVLISTDVLSEGLNLQDATRLINYDLHWNPVRLMQRIGRVDRRLNPAIEDKILQDHPEQKKLRGKTAYWNFLPPEELETLLALYGRVAHKTLRISKVFGIEGRKLLTPADDYEALKNFNASYEGTTTPIEEMHLEYQRLVQNIPDLEGRLQALPGRVFSGKEYPGQEANAVFFCYRIPGPDYDYSTESQNQEQRWTEEAGETHWLLYHLDSEKILEEASEIHKVIQSDADTLRRCEFAHETLTEIRQKVEKHLKNSHLKRLQAPAGVKPLLKAWMELG